MTPEDPSRGPPAPTPVGLQFFFGMIAGIVVAISTLAAESMTFLYVAAAVAVLLAPILWATVGWHGYTAGLLFVAAGIVLAIGGCTAAWRGSWDAEVLGTVLMFVVPLAIAIVCILVYGGRRGG